MYLEQIHEANDIKKLNEQELEEKGLSSEQAKTEAFYAIKEGR